MRIAKIDHTKHEDFVLYAVVDVAHDLERLREAVYYCDRLFLDAIIEDLDTIVEKWPSRDGLSGALVEIATRIRKV